MTERKCDCGKVYTVTDKAVSVFRGCCAKWYNVERDAPTKRKARKRKEASK